MITDNANNPVAYIIRGGLPTTILDRLAIDITNLRHTVALTCVPDSRGTQQSIRLGHYLERGGLGRILQSKFQLSEEGKRLYQTYSTLWDHVSGIAQTYDIEYYNTLLQIPEEYRSLGIFSLFVCNLLPPNNVHRDCKDFKWCFLFLFGNFVQSGLYLYYLNLYVTMRPGDLLMLQSNKIWHKADSNVTKGYTRYSGILTTHNGLLQRCISMNKGKL